LLDLYHKGAGLIPGQSTWNLYSKEWQWDRFCLWTTSVFHFSTMQKILHPYMPVPFISAIALAIQTVVKTLSSLPLSSQHCIFTATK